MDQVIVQRHGGCEPVAAFPEDDPARHEERSQSGRLAVMCVDDRGRLLFATDRALALCERWNEALEPTAAALRLPGGIDALYAAAHAVRGQAPSTLPESMPGRWSVHHPACPELILTVDVDGRQPRGGGCGLLWLEEDPLPFRLQALSPSERRVALLVAQGLRNHQIAEQLCRSRRTVEFQLNSIYRKLEVSCRTQLVRALL